jgi:leader peptidase (prepilin peptidase)/N-methyltransferase
MSLDLIKFIFAFLVGISIGSFLNVCILRWPADLSIVTPASHCPSCKTSLPWYTNIPLVSYLFLRGKCKFCQTRISPRYFFVELLTGLLFVMAVWHHSEWIFWPFDAYFLSALVITTFIDLDHWIIPDKITLPGIVIGLGSAFLLPGAEPLFHLIGAVFGGCSLLFVGWVYTKISGKDGIGGGDIKFLAMAGAFLGFPAVLIVLILSSVLGSVLGIILILAYGKGAKTAIPFGPFLAAASLITFLFGAPIWKWYFHIA